MRGRVVVKFSVDLECAGGNCFFLLEDGYTIRVVLSEAASERHTVELPLYFRKARKDPRALFVRPFDTELATWLVESSVVHKDLARVELQLSHCPAHIGAALREL